MAKQPTPWIIPPKRRNYSGTRDWINGIEATARGTLGDVATQAFREVIAQAGMNPFSMHVELGANTEILRPAADETERPQGYPFMLKLTFAEMPHSEHQQATDMIDTLALQLHEAWNDQKTDHKPGAIRAASLPSGERCITVAHDDLARLSNIMNKVLRHHGVPTIDTRLKALGFERSDATQAAR